MGLAKSKAHREAISRGLKKSEKKFRRPWKAWITPRKKGPVLLQWGLDFDCEVPSMVAMLRKNATDLGVRVRLQVRGDKISITMKKPDEEK